MKTFLFAVIAAFSMSSAAMAFDVTERLALDNEIDLEYSVDADVWTSEYTANLNYDVTDSVLVYAETVVDINDVTFTGAEFGVEWTTDANLTPGSQFTAATFVQVDEDFDNEQFFVSLNLQF